MTPTRLLDKPKRGGRREGAGQKPVVGRPVRRTVYLGQLDVELITRHQQPSATFSMTLRALLARLDELLAENERWREVVKTFSAGNVALEAENERLRRDWELAVRIAESHAAEAERLRDALALIVHHQQPSSSEMRRIASDALGRP